MSDLQQKADEESSFMENLKDTLRRGKTIDTYDYNVKKRYHEPAPKEVFVEEFRHVVESRRAVRKFTDKKIPKHVLDACLDLALLAPSSSNLQPWEFHVVQTPDIKRKVVEACMSQNAAITAAELIVVVARTKSWREVAKLNVANWPQPRIPQHWKEFYTRTVYVTYWQGPLHAVGSLKKVLANITGMFRPMIRGPFTKSDMRVWAHKSTALAAQNLMLAFRAYGFDSCPMEGFDEVRIRKLLKLPSDAEVVMLMGAGERAQDGVYFPRAKFDRNNFIRYL